MDWLIPMQPSPMADTSSPWVPSLRLGSMRGSPGRPVPGKEPVRSPAGQRQGMRDGCAGGEGHPLKFAETDAGLDEQMRRVGRSTRSAGDLARATRAGQ